MVRKYPIRRSSRIVWLFCEGKTEKYYFEQFKARERIREVGVEIMTSNKTDPVGLIKNALAFKKNRGRDFFKDDEIYCIFDRDQHKDSHLSKAFILANKNKIKLIFSNPCFEYWILCHFEKYSIACQFNDIERKLKEHMGEYEKADYDLYSKTSKNISRAIANAKSVAQIHQRAGNKNFTIKRNPSTNIYELIEYLFSLKN